MFYEAILKNFIEIEPVREEEFLKIKETLTRVGVASTNKKKLFQSCHIFHKKGHYYITHFKEMFMLDGKCSELSKIDTGRRNAIALLLEKWGLLEIKSPSPADLKENLCQMNNIKIISYKDKKNWELCVKYTIGKLF